LLFFSGLCLHGEFLPSFRADVFHRQNGLPATMLKTVLRDQQGRVWVGADNDLFYYDGWDWIRVFRNDPSIRVKSLKQLRDGTLMVVSDYALFRIEQVNEEWVPVLVQAFTDPRMVYAKNLYEDASGRLWLASPRHIFLLEWNQWVCYNLDFRRHYESYLHSHFFMETGLDHPVVFSHSAELQVWESGRFRRMDWCGPQVIHDLIDLGHGEALLATDRGIERLRIDGATVLSSEILLKVPGVTAMALRSDRSLIFATSGREVWVTPLDQIGKVQHLIARQPSQVHRIIHDDSGVLWLVMDQQLMRLEFHPLMRRSSRDPSPFLLDDGAGGVILADQASLIQVDAELREMEICTFPQRILSAVRLDEGYAVGLLDGRIDRLGADGRTLSTYKLQNAVIDLHDDPHGNLWASLDQGKGLVRIDPSGDIQTFGVEQFPLGVNCVRSSPDGVVHAISNAVDDFVWRWDSLKDRFVSIVPLPPGTSELSSLSVHDLSWDASKALLIATNRGVIRNEAGTSEWLDLSGLGSQEFLAFRSDPKGKSLWAATYDGLMRWSSDGVWQLDTLSGLGSSLSRYRNLVLEDGYLWVDTLDGLVRLDLDSREAASYQPTFHAAICNGRVTPELPSTIGNGENWLFQFKSPELPQGTTRFHFVCKSSDGKVVREFEDMRGLFALEGLRSGSYLLELRSKRSGLYAWSQPWVHSIYLRNSLWDRLALCVLILTVVGLGIWWRLEIRRRRNRDQLLRLNRLVEERTKALAEKNEQLSRSNQVREQLISIISHDLRGSMGGIVSLLNLIGEEGFGKAGTRGSGVDSLELLKGEASSAYQLLENLLGWAKQQQGSVSLQFEPVDLCLVVDAVRDLFQYRIAGKALLFECTCEAGRPVKADRNSVETVMRNLVGNAVKFCRSGDRIMVSTRVIGEKLRVEVADTGPGIDAAICAHLLDPARFFTSRGSADEGGSGMGLSVCVELLRLMDSRLEVASERGAGARFWFDLPLTF
jgi:signal transduction histidine kinase/ligand-binding sensor domain-containing protein